MKKIRLPRKLKKRLKLMGLYETRMDLLRMAAAMRVKYGV